MKQDGHIMATDLMLWCSNNEPVAPAPGKDDFHMETVCTLVNIIGNAARSSVKVLTLCPPVADSATTADLSKLQFNAVYINAICSALNLAVQLHLKFQGDHAPVLLNQACPLT